MTCRPCFPHFEARFALISVTVAGFKQNLDPKLSWGQGDGARGEQQVLLHVAFDQHLSHSLKPEMVLFEAHMARVTRKSAIFRTFWTQMAKRGLRPPLGAGAISAKAWTICSMSWSKHQSPKPIHLDGHALRHPFRAANSRIPATGRPTAPANRGAAGLC